MRILHLIPSLVGGGAERQIAHLASGQRERGCEVHVGIFRGGINRERLERAGAVIHEIEAAGNYDPRLVFRVMKLIRAVRPDFVQTWLAQMDVVGGVAARLTRTPWIISERSSGAHYPRDAKHRLRRFLGRFATAIVANSSGGFSFWRGSKASRFVVPNALALDEIAAAPRDETDFGASRVILFVGRLDAEKNLSNLIIALQDVIAQRDAVALFCGIGPKENEVRSEIEQAGCTDRIRLLGYTDRVWSLMKRADAIVAPSWFEGHPNVVMEAAAAGCPLVLSDIPAHRECLGDAALFAPPEDPEALARAILQTLDDPAEARARAGRARAIAADWSIDRAASAYMRIYEELARGAQSAAARSTGSVSL